MVTSKNKGAYFLHFVGLTSFPTKKDVVLDIDKNFFPRFYSWDYLPLISMHLFTFQRLEMNSK